MAEPSSKTNCPFVFSLQMQQLISTTPASFFQISIAPLFFVSKWSCMLMQNCDCQDRRLHILQCFTTRNYKGESLYFCGFYNSLLLLNVHLFVVRMYSVYSCSIDIASEYQFLAKVDYSRLDSMFIAQFYVIELFRAQVHPYSMEKNDIL